jgi:hypothetical protein
MRDNSFLSNKQTPDEIVIFTKVNEKKVLAKLFVHYLTEKIEWIDNLPENFYLMNEGNLYGEPTVVNAPSFGEDYKLYTIRYKRYNLDGSIENCTLSLYVANSDFNTNVLPPDHPISISLQIGFCSGSGAICFLAPTPTTCSDGCLLGSGCCQGKYECDCADFGGGGCCFAGETLITMADGSKKEIQNIIDGDQILSYNFKTGENETNIVSDIHIRILRNLYIYKFENGTSLIASDDHPLYILHKGWASMNPTLSTQSYKSLTSSIHQVEIGDSIFGQNNQHLKIVDIQIKHYPGKVYSIINNNKSCPTYYANGVLAY